MKKTLTIIIPNYKRDCSLFFSKIIKDPRLEVIMVFDGDEGISFEAIDNAIEYGGNILTNFTLRKNMGPMVARTVGLCESHSKFIMFIDSDDAVEIKPELLEYLDTLNDEDNIIGYSGWIDNYGRTFESCKNPSMWVDSPGLTGYVFSSNFIDDCIDVGNVTSNYFAEEIPTAYNIYKYENVKYIDMSHLYNCIADDTPDRGHSLYMKVAGNDNEIDIILEAIKPYKLKYPEFYDKHYNFINDYMRNHYKKKGD